MMWQAWWSDRHGNLGRRYARDLASFCMCFRGVRCVRSSVSITPTVDSRATRWFDSNVGSNVSSPAFLHIKPRATAGDSQETTSNHRSPDMRDMLCRDDWIHCGHLVLQGTKVHYIRQGTWEHDFGVIWVEQGSVNSPGNLLPGRKFWRSRGLVTSLPKSLRECLPKSEPKRWWQNGLMIESWSFKAPVFQYTM